MLERPNFVKKQIIFLFANRGEKISFKNDNIVVTDKEGKTNKICKVLDEVWASNTIFGI